MAVSLKPVTTDKELKQFIQFPFSLYRDSPFWVPPLISGEFRTLSRKHNPAFDHCDAQYWIAEKDGKPAGRIGAIINHKANEKWGTAAARFSWVDFIDDFETASALFGQAEQWAKERSMRKIHGPMGFTNLDKEGMLIEGFDEMGSQPMIYNYPYYPKMVEKLGYAKEADWIEFEIFAPEAIPDKVQRVHELVLKRSSCRILPFDSPKQLADTYGHAVFRLMERAYSILYGTTPLSDRQIDSYIRQYVPLLDHRFTILLADEHDELVGFGIAMPSLSGALRKAGGRLFPFGWYHLRKAMKHPKKIDLYLVAVAPEYRNRGLNAIILAEITRNAIEAGVQSAESSGEWEDNIAVQQMWKFYDHRQHKRRRSYVKELQEP